MEAMEEKIQEQILKKINAEELEKLIIQRISDFYGLLNRDAALRLIANEFGIIDKNVFCKIKEIKKDERNINITATVSKVLSKVITPTQKIYRDMELKDENGAIVLRLWGKDTEFFSKIKIGDVIEIKNGYEKNKRLNLSYKGSLSLIKRAPFMNIEENTEGFVNVLGKVTKIQGERSYSKNGMEKSYFSFFLGSSDGKEKRCIIWDLPERGKNLEVGDDLIIENTLSKNNEFHLSYNSRILQKSQRTLRGTIEEIFCTEEDGKENVVLGICGKKLLFDRENALKLLQVNVADDISLSTVLTIKKSFLQNRLSLKGKEMNGMFIFD